MILLALDHHHSSSAAALKEGEHRVAGCRPTDTLSVDFISSIVVAGSSSLLTCLNSLDAASFLVRPCSWGRLLRSTGLIFNSSHEPTLRESSSASAPNTIELSNCHQQRRRNLIFRTYLSHSADFRPSPTSPNHSCERELFLLVSFHSILANIFGRLQWTKVGSHLGECAPC